MIRGDVLVVKVRQHLKAEDLTIPIDPVLHPAVFHIGHDVIHEAEISRGRNPHLLVATLVAGQEGAVVILQGQQAINRVAERFDTGNGDFAVPVVILGRRQFRLSAAFLGLLPHVLPELPA